jgi:HSF-type DNA-binding
MSLPPKKPRHATEKASAGLRLNKFVRRLHDMICGEKNSGIVQWRRGLLVLLDTKVFAKQILPKYFNTRNFKTFRRQLNYYGFVHVRSYSNSGTKSTTALWVNQELATGKIEGEDDCTRHDLNNIASVLQLKRVEPCESVKTSEGRRVRKELAMSTIEEDLGVSAQSIQLQQFYVISEERPKIAADELFTVQPPIHINTPYLEHCNWSSASTPLVPERLKQESTVPTAATKDRRYVKASENSHYCLDTLNADNVEMKPPTSSTSVANLLLLLSSAG